MNQLFTEWPDCSDVIWRASQWGHCHHVLSKDYTMNYRRGEIILLFGSNYTEGRGGGWREIIKFGHNLQHFKYRR